jgi:hypothetical protein
LPERLARITESTGVGAGEVVAKRVCLWSKVVRYVSLKARHGVVLLFKTAGIEPRNIMSQGRNSRSPIKRHPAISFEIPRIDRDAPCPRKE